MTSSRSCRTTFPEVARCEELANLFAATADLYEKDLVVLGVEAVEEALFYRVEDVVVLVCFAGAVRGHGCTSQVLEMNSELAVC